MSATEIPHVEYTITDAAAKVATTVQGGPAGTGIFNWWLYLLMIGQFIIVVLVSIFYERSQKIKAEKAQKDSYMGVVESDDENNDNIVAKSQGI